MPDAPPKPSVGMMLANLAATLPSTLISAVLEQVRIAGVEQGKAEHRAEFLIEQHERAVQQAVAEATAELRETVAALSAECEAMRTDVQEGEREIERLRAANHMPPKTTTGLLDQEQADRLYKLAQDPIATYGVLSPKVKGLKPSDVSDWPPPKRMDALRWATTDFPLPSFLTAFGAE